MTLQLNSHSFAHGSTIPVQFTADGEDLSPQLCWLDPPEGTVSFAIICDDPDAPRGTWVHWVIFDLLAQTRELKSGVKPDDLLETGAKQGLNDFGNVGYGGPAPPKGKPHRYVFRLYALDKKLNLQPATTRNAVDSAMKGHILTTGELLGMYQRP